MSVINTYCEDNKTIRVWQESRGGKTLTRKFYLRYAVNVIVNRTHHMLMCDTYDEALAKRAEWMGNVEKHRGFRTADWFKSRTPLTHIDECGFMSVHRKGYSASIYLTTEAGERISEVIQ